MRPRMLVLTIMLACAATQALGAEGSDLPVDPSALMTGAFEAPDPASAPPLGLAEALSRALESNPQVAVSRLSPRIAEAALRRERSAWDGRARASHEFNDVTDPAASGLDGATVRQSETRSTSFGVVQPFVDGSTLEAAWTDRRTLTNSAFALLNPQYRAGVSVTWRRPLRRGFGQDVNRRSMARAEVSLESSRWELARDVQDTLAAVERAYWNLAAARDQRSVARLSLEQAQTLLEANRYRAEAGLLARLAVVEAEAAVAERRDALLVSEREVQRAHNEVLRLVDPPARPGQKIGDLADVPGVDLPAPPVWDEVVAQLLVRNPRYRLSLLELETQKVELAFARDGLLPRLDLVTTLSTNGLAGGRGNAIEAATELDFPTWFVGLSYEMPFGNRAAKAEHERVKLTVERAVRTVKALETDLETQAFDRLQRYTTDLGRIHFSRLRIETALAKLHAEEERYREGLISADDLLRFQRELAEARASEVNSRVAASLSLLDLWALIGVLPERRGVALDAERVSADR